MKRIKYILPAVLMLSFILLISCSQNTPIDPVQSTTGSTTSTHYIVVMKTTTGNSLQSIGAAHDEVQSLISSIGIPQTSVGHIYDAVLKGFSADLNADQLERLTYDSRVAFVEKDQLMYLVDPVIVIKEDDHERNGDGGVNAESQTIPWGVTRVGGPSTATSFAHAWIVDTGINLTHPDLNVQTAQCTTFVRSGRDSRTNDDLNGHGSHVSGIIAAIDNTIGVVGVAPDAPLIGVKVLNSAGSGSVSDIVAGLNYVYSHASSGDVVNCSFGGGRSTSLDNAISQFATRNHNGGTWVSICIAAGNSSANAANTSPARVNGDGIYTISAFRQGDVFSTFSNWGNPPIDFSAPGQSIYSTYRNHGYATLSGTSMAAPHVCGIILAREAAGASRTPATDGHVTGDPDGNPDPIAHE